MVATTLCATASANPKFQSPDPGPESIERELLHLVADLVADLAFVCIEQGRRLDVIERRTGIHQGQGIHHGDTEARR